eukprot:COSAG01_NODE_1060_length_11890_cov_17.763973_12_plen_68_part_00
MRGHTRSTDSSGQQHARIMQPAACDAARVLGSVAHRRGPAAAVLAALAAAAALRVLLAALQRGACHG